MTHRRVAQNYLEALTIIPSVLFSHSVALQFTWILPNLSWNKITMPALDRNHPVKCTKCNKIVANYNIARHKKSCDSGTLSCPKCPNLYTKKKEDLNYHLALHRVQKDITPIFLCTVCLEEIPSFCWQKLGSSRVKAQRISRIGGTRQKQRAISSTFMTMQKWRMGDIKCSTSNCPSSIPMRSKRS